MGLALGGLQSNSGSMSIASILAALVGQDIVARSFTSSQASGSDAFKVTTNGARWHFGAGASDYATSDGTSVTFANFISAAQGFVATSGNFQARSASGGLSIGTAAKPYLAVSNGGAQVLIAGVTTNPALSALRMEPQSAEPTGPNLVGDIYVTTAGVLKICTAAGSPGTWISVGAQT